MFIVNNAFRTPNISNVPYKSKFDTPPPSKCIAMCNNRNVWVQFYASVLTKMITHFPSFHPQLFTCQLRSFPKMSNTVKSGRLVLNLRCIIFPFFLIHRLSKAALFGAISPNALGVLPGTYISLVFKIP